MGVSLHLARQYVLANAVFAAFELGLFSALGDRGERALDVSAFAREKRLKEPYVQGLVDLLRRHGLLEHRDGGVGLSAEGVELVESGLATIAFFVGGYGEVIRRVGPLCRGDIEYGEDIERDGHFVALSAALAGQKSTFDVVSSRAKELRPRRILDVGCGSGDFLLQLLDACSAEKAYGLDLSEEACRIARENAAARGVGDKVEIYRCDVRQALERVPELEGTVDVITGLFVFHELLGGNHDSMTSALRRLGTMLRPGGALLILDKQTDVLDKGEAPPFFTEFKYLHDVTDQELCDQATWKALLNEAGFDVTATPLALNSGNVFLECVRRS